MRIPTLTLLLIAWLFSACSNPLLPENRVKKELENRSFFYETTSKNTIKIVHIIFNDGIELYLAYVDNEIATNEWEIEADDYKVLKQGSEYRIDFLSPRSEQTLPTKCKNCVQTTGISILVKNPFNEGKIRFKLNFENNNFPPPYPVLESWTKFEE